MAKKLKKKTSEEILTKHDPLTPLNLKEIGDINSDPCFGKAYDLSTKECKLCGDSELCAIKMSQMLNVTRKELEEKNQYKDLDILEDVAGMKKYMRGLIRKGKERKEIIIKTSEKFEVPKKIVRKIYKELKQ